MIRDFMVDWFSWIQTFVKKKKEFWIDFFKNDYFGNTRHYHNRSLLPMNSILKLLESWSFNAGNTDLTLTFFFLSLTALVPIGAQVCMKPHLSFMRYFLQVVTAERISDISIISSISQKFDDWYFVDLNLKFFCQFCKLKKHFRNLYKTHKSTKNSLSNIGLIEESMDLSHILLTV